MVTRRVGEAPVYSQYIVPREPAPDDKDLEPGEKKKKKRKGGQNKNRRQPFRQLLSNRLCPSVIRNEECGITSQVCKKIHDKKQFLEIKGCDLGEECVIFNKFGKCSYGIACRYGSKHLDSELNSVVDEAKWEKMKIYEVKKTLSKDLHSYLRGKKVWFGASYTHLENVGIQISNELLQHRTKNKRAKVENPEGEVSEEPITTDAVFEEVREEYYCLSGKPRRTLGDTIRGKTFLAPLTTVGNLPFRRVCKEYGVDVTCGEMALCEDLLQGNASEWALMKRHHTEDIFGVQICANSPLKVAKTVELISSECNVDFIDLNVGCPIDLVYNKGAGSALMDRALRLEQMVEAMVAVSSVPISVKVRIGTSEKNITGKSLCERLSKTGVSHLAMHGRTRQQRYTKHADWDYVAQCREVCQPVPLFGNGYVLSYEDYNTRLQQADGVMIARGALIKPWIFQEIKEQRHIDISSSERLDMLKRFRDYGLEHWGTDIAGVEKCRHFLLEWLSFLYRYIPVGLLEVLPQRINERPPTYFGRDDLETLMCSPKSSDWIQITEMLLGKVPDEFNFVPKHVANSYN